jgi:hypothetical protein
MTVSDLLKKLDRLPAEADIFIADNSITGWPIQVPIDSILHNDKNKQVFLIASDTQSIPPDDVIEKITFRDK